MFIRTKKNRSAFDESSAYKDIAVLAGHVRHPMELTDDESVVKKIKELAGRLNDRNLARKILAKDYADHVLGLRRHIPESDLPDRKQLVAGRCNFPPAHTGRSRSSGRLVPCRKMVKKIKYFCDSHTSFARRYDYPLVATKEKPEMKAEMKGKEQFEPVCFDNCTFEDHVTGEFCPNVGTVPDFHNSMLKWCEDHCYVTDHVLESRPDHCQNLWKIRDLDEQIRECTDVQQKQKLAYERLDLAYGCEIGTPESILELAQTLV